MTTTDTMQAVVYTRYGPPHVLQLKEVEKPQPKDHEILIRVKATAVNSGDCRLRRADPFLVRLFFGLFRPKKKILGVVLSGIVEKTGKDVTRFREGDEVFGLTDMNLGAYAQYVCLPETAALALKPQNATHEEAAAIPFGGHTALHFLKKADVKPGQKVLIYGASGAVGTAAVQLAKYYGAEVTGVCSTANIGLVKSIGADKVIDYRKDDFARVAEEYDLIFETVDKASVAELVRHLKENGKLILGSSMIRGTLQAWLASRQKPFKFLAGEAKATAADMNFLKELAETGQLRPVIDRSYSLEQMAEAHEYVEGGHKKGNVAVIL